MYFVRLRFIRLFISILVVSVSASMNVHGTGINYYSTNNPVTFAFSGQLKREFSFFKVDTGGGILPLHNFSLTITLKENTVFLKWLAENEMNTEKFVVQRSTDGSTFKDLGALPPAGPVNILTEYNSTDDILGLSISVVYYRVKAEDNRGYYAYSNVVPVRLSKTAGFSLWPNPFSTSLNLSYNAATSASIRVEVYDNSGRRALQQPFNVNRGINQLTINGVSGLSHGFYLVRITDLMTNEVTSSRIIK